MSVFWFGDQNNTADEIKQLESARQNPTDLRKSRFPDESHVSTAEIENLSLLLCVF